jgi:ArsR family transcriptional regulator
MFGSLKISKMSAKILFIFHMILTQLSFHLKILKNAGLIQSRAEGRWIYYRLNLAQFIALEEYLSEFRRFSPIWPSRKCD